MGNIRTGYKGTYALGKHELYMAIHYALMYHELKEAYNAIEVSAKGINYGEKIKTGGGDPTYTLAEKRAEIRSKIDKIESAAHLASEKYYKYIMKAVTEEGANFNLLKTRYDMPCGKNTFYVLRRKFYYLLAKMI